MEIRHQHLNPTEVEDAENELEAHGAFSGVRNLFPSRCLTIGDKLPEVQIDLTHKTGQTNKESVL